VEETGRYYLLWAAPILKKTKGKEAFKGAVALKIDLWDCFQKYSKTAETPFLIRMGRLSLYSYKWNDTFAFVEEPLLIPGVEKITVKYPKSGGTAAAAAENVQPSVTPAVDSNKIKAAEDSVKALQAKQAKGHKRVVGLIVLLLIIAGIAGAKYMADRRHKRLLQQIDEEV
jgi:hypothetical protein